MTVQEIFTNNAATTVSSGGTTAPSGGSGESWTVASSSSFPAASNSATPPTQFHVADPALPGEIIAVTNVSGTTWTVTRGAEGTTPVAHTSGFAIVQVISAAALTQLASGVLLNARQYAPAPAVTASVSSSTLTAFDSTNINTGNFTAPASGIVIIEVSFTGTPPASTIYGFALALHGTSTLVSYVQTMEASSASTQGPHILRFLITGLGAGTAYNFDLMGASASGTLTINAGGIVSSTPTGSVVTPVVFTVRAV